MPEPGEAVDPYQRFWEIMTAYPFGEMVYWPPPPHPVFGRFASRETSARYRDEEVIFPRVVRVSESEEKCWDDFDLVFFWGHNNTIRPPHPTQPIAVWSCAAEGELIEGNLQEWGTPALPYCYWAEYPITDADAHPGAVTYLYNKYTSCLIGPAYDYNGTDFSPYHEHWNDPINYTYSGRLGYGELEWLILHGCQAVITASYSGRTHLDLALKTFGQTHGCWHLVMGHYRSFSRTRPVDGFAFDLVFGVPIQRAYFDTDPANNSSAIAAESTSPVPSPFPWHTSVMENDRWTDPLPDICHARFFSERWITTWPDFTEWPSDSAQSAKSAKESTAEDSLTLGTLPIESQAACQLLGTNVLKLRSAETDYRPIGNVPVLRLEAVDDPLCHSRMTNVIGRCFSTPIPAHQILTVSDLMVGTTSNEVCWINRSSGSYKYTRTAGSSATPTPYTNYYTPVQIALDYVAANHLITPAPGEEVDLLYVSAVQNALSDIYALDQPLELFRSDYYVAFGRRFQGIPIIGSELILRIDGHGEVVMVSRNWRRIEQATQEQMHVTTNSLAALIVQDPRFIEVFGTNPVAPAQIHILNMQCGYLEASCSYRQNELRVGGTIGFSLGTNWSESSPEMNLSLEDGRGLDWLGGEAYHPVGLSINECGPDGSCHLTLTSYAGRDYTIQASTNLLDWAPTAITLSNVNGSVPFVDPQAATRDRQRFYRALEIR